MRIKNLLNPAVLIAAAGLFIVASCTNNTAHIPILGTRTAYTHEVKGKQVTDTLYHTIPAFKMLDQDSTLTDNSRFNGHIYVADFFFTSCPSICPIMQKNMLKLFKEFKDERDIAFLSYTIDPLHDTPAKLKKYSRQLGVDGKKWYFVTGNRDSTYVLAEKGYYATAKSDSTAPGGFVHSGGLILVDKERRIRGIYDGTQEEEVDKLSQDLKLLQAEETR